MSDVSHYKVVETSTVTAEELEELLNRHARLGWRFDGFHFVARDNSRRPAMAFILFTRDGPGKEETQPEPTGRRTDEH